MAAGFKFGARGQAFVADGRCYSCGRKHTGETARCVGCLRKKRDYDRKRRLKRRNAQILAGYEQGHSLSALAQQFRVSYGYASSILTVERMQLGLPPRKIGRPKGIPNKSPKREASKERAAHPAPRNTAMRNAQMLAGYEQGHSAFDLAQQFGVSYGYALQILRSELKRLGLPPYKSPNQDASKEQTAQRDIAIANLREAGGRMKDLMTATGLSYGRIQHICSHIRKSKPEGFFPLTVTYDPPDENHPEWASWARGRELGIPDYIPTGKTRDILQSRLEGDTLHVIAERYQVSRQRIHQIIKKSGMPAGSPKILRR